MDHLTAMDGIRASSNAKSRRKSVARIATALAVALLATVADIAHPADLFVIHIAPYTGRDASVGREYGQGARLYFDHVNAQGGVRGSKVILDARDDAGDPELTRMQAVSASEEQPVAFIGTVGTDNVRSLLPSLERLHAPLLAAVVDSAGVSATRDRYVFHVRPDLAQEIDAVGARLYDFGMRNIVLCGAAGDELRLVDEAGAPRRDATASSALCEGDAARIASSARAIASSGAQAVIYAGPAPEAAAFVEALRASRSFALVVTTSAVDPRALARALPSSARVWLAVAETIPNPRLGKRSIADPIVREFLSMRESDRSEIPVSRESLAGFMAAKLTVAAIRRAGENPTAATVHHALGDMRTIDKDGVGIAFEGRENSPNHVRLGILGSNGTLLN